jgi:catalase
MNMDNFFDFTSQNPETTNGLVWFFTDLGTPSGYRHMNISMINTYRLVKSTDEWYYARFTMVPDQGIKNFTAAEAADTIVSFFFF